MANKNVFRSGPHSKIRNTTHRNAAGGRAYKLDDAEALCQYVVTSTFSDVYYASAGEQLKEVQRLCGNVDPETIAKAAVYGRQRGKMKDVPAYLCAHLAAIGRVDLLKKVFPKVIDNPKMLLNFVQIVRSGVTGRRSFGSAVKKLIQNWITSKRGNQLFRASIGKSDPSLVDVIKMVHPTPTSQEQSALFAYLLGAQLDGNDPEMLIRKGKDGKVLQEYAFTDLPPLTQEFEWFKFDNSMPIPDLDYRALTNCSLTKDHWKEIAKNMPWNTLRMNLNVLARNGVFEDDEMVDKVAAKIANPTEVERWSVFPYQLMTSYLYTKDDVPAAVKNSLQIAMEHATKNVPQLGRRVGIAVDVSGSMHSSVTGYRTGQASVVRCCDVAALIASSLARTNTEATIVGFGTQARITPGFNPWDSVMTNSQKLVAEGSVLGYGTNAGAAMDVFNAQRKPYDFIVYVSDCQSWVDSRGSSMFSGYGRGYGGNGTPLMEKWATQRVGNKNAKLAEINVAAYGDSQADSKDKSILNVGGFSDAVFDVLAEFAERTDNVSFLSVVDRVEL